MVLKIWFQTSSIKVNSVLARNADSWASLQAHWIKNSGVGPKNLICTAGCYDACSNLSPRALERRGQRPLASNRNSEIGIHSLLPHLEEWPLLYHFLGSKGYVINSGPPGHVGVGYKWVQKPFRTFTLTSSNSSS